MDVVTSEHRLAFCAASYFFLSGLRWVVRYCLINVLTNFFVSTYG